MATYLLLSPQKSAPSFVQTTPTAHERPPELLENALRVRENFVTPTAELSVEILRVIEDPPDELLELRDALIASTAAAR